MYTYGYVILIIYMFIYLYTYVYVIYIHRDMAMDIDRVQSNALDLSILYLFCGRGASFAGRTKPFFVFRWSLRCAFWFLGFHRSQLVETDCVVGSFRV